MKQFIIPFLFAACLFTTACSDDDEPNIPTDAITLNMSIGDNGTTIGGSDVFINSSHNFTTSSCGISDLGKKGGFDRNPNLAQIAQEVAVSPGSYYQIMHARDIENVGGARAFSVNTNYYNVYVDSWINDKDGDISGAKVSYAECYPKDNKLPKWDSTIEIDFHEYGSQYEYSFDNGLVADPYFDIYTSENSNMSERLDIEVKDNHVTFTVSGTAYGSAEVVMLVRHESLFTRVRFIVQ